MSQMCWQPTQTELPSTYVRTVTTVEPWNLLPSPFMRLKYYNSINQIRALSLVRNATTDKIKLLKNIPKKFHKSDLEYNKYEENIEQPKNFKVILE